MGVSAKISWEGLLHTSHLSSRLSDEKICAEFQLTNLDTDQSDGRQLAQLLGAQGMHGSFSPAHRRAQCALAAAHPPRQTAVERTGSVLEWSWS